MGKFGVSISHYGGASWAIAELERQLALRDVRILDIRGCAYPEMARAEQVRQARAAGIETLVFIDSHVDATVEDVEELARVADTHGVCIASDSGPWALEAAAVRRDVLEAMVRAEERTYENSAVVDTMWNGQKIAAVPLASPWNRDGSPLVAGRYLSDSEAFLERARRAGAVVAQHFPDHLIPRRRPMRSLGSNLDQPITDDVGSHFALCIPSFGALDLDQQASVYALEKVGMVVLRLHDCPWIDQARSWLTEQALRLGRGVFFLDHDIQFKPNDVLWQCEAALERHAVVAGAYCMRRSGKNIIGSLDVKPGKMRFFEGGSIQPAFYAGLGFAAIPRDVLEGIGLPVLHSEGIARGLGASDRIRPWYALDCSTGFYAGEDVSFCNRVHDLTVRMQEEESGFDTNWELSHSGRPARVFIDTRTRIFHRGVYDYGIEDAGIVVPRIGELDATLVPTRKEAREILVNALDLPVDVNLAAREFAEDEEHAA